MTPDSTLAVTNTCPKDGVHLYWTPDSRSIYRITTVLKQLRYARSRGARDDGGEGRKWVWSPPDGPAQLEL